MTDGDQADIVAMAEALDEARETITALRAELDAARAREVKLREALSKTTANLRHAYANLFSTAMSADDTRRFADGLIAPEIRRLEAALAEGEDTQKHVWCPECGYHCAWVRAGNAALVGHQCATARRTSR